MAVLIAPDSDAIRGYHGQLQTMRAGDDTQHEGNTRFAFANLLDVTARQYGLTLVQEHQVRLNDNAGRSIRYDGMLRDDNNLPHGYWEAKDSADNLEREIEQKRDRGYSFKNIIFEDTRTAVLYQRGDRVLSAPVDDATRLADLLTRFYQYEIPPFDDFRAAVTYFKQEVSSIARGLQEKIAVAHREVRDFQRAFAGFMNLCREALNPNIREEAVDEMLIQHLLTERIIRKIFDVETFTRRNVIAREIETVIEALSSAHFNRAEFLGSLDHVYRAIEAAADEVESFTEKQAFLNTVYERFFQGYSVKVADTHGIVYTPQEIVDFMCAAVEEVLMDEFGLPLGDPAVKIIDPATGTGNFIVNLLNRVGLRDLDRFYREQLFANEVMLMPYYIASLNIERAYYDRAGHYEAFQGISFVDTLDLAEGKQLPLGLFTEENTARVRRQQDAEINVIIANPPYNVGQVNENDNNKNRAYEVIDKRVKDTYVKDSTATNKNALYDPYVKFFRWATDRLGDRDGVVCMVTNNSFVDGLAFDGMRKHLMQDFHRIYVVDLQGNIRKDSMRDGIPLGEEHTVFGLAAMVGISITVLVRKKSLGTHRLFYTSADWRATRVEKFRMLEEAGTLNGLQREEITPNDKHTWLVAEHEMEFDDFIPIGDKKLKSAKEHDVESIFKTYGRGVATSRDKVVYDFDRDTLETRAQQFVHDYNAEVERYQRTNPKPTAKEIDDFVDYSRVSWSESLKGQLKRGTRATFEEHNIRSSLYRPFSRRNLYFDSILNERQYQFPRIFPTPETEAENRVIVVSDKGYRATAPTALMTNLIPELHLSASSDAHQCFPFYTYDEDGGNRRENITNWALAQFQQHYGDDAISKWDIFYYVYGLLHHPAYRERYADNLKKSLPRMPFAPDFRAFCQAGRDLAEWHLHYEDVEGYRLRWEVAKDKDGKDKPLDTRVTDKMKLQGQDKTCEAPHKVYARLKVNETLTLHDIPPAAFAYRLGNRSALEWVVDQYCVKTDKRSGIKSDPNQYSDDERYIVDLVEKVVRVSVDTVRVVEALAELPFQG